MLKNRYISGESGAGHSINYSFLAQSFHCVPIFEIEFCWKIPTKLFKNALKRRVRWHYFQSAIFFPSVWVSFKVLRLIRSSIILQSTCTLHRCSNQRTDSIFSLKYRFVDAAISYNTISHSIDASAFSFTEVTSTQLFIKLRIKSDRNYCHSVRTFLRPDTRIRAIYEGSTHTWKFYSNKKSSTKACCNLILACIVNWTWNTRIRFICSIPFACDQVKVIRFDKKL